MCVRVLRLSQVCHLQYFICRFTGFTSRGSRIQKKTSLERRDLDFEELLNIRHGVASRTRSWSPPNAHNNDLQQEEEEEEDHGDDADNYQCVQ